MRLDGNYTDLELCWEIIEFGVTEFGVTKGEHIGSPETKHLCFLDHSSQSPAARHELVAFTAQVRVPEASDGSKT